ncbi:hypothetical protein H9P43_006473 [Blastocladiella emersonii ATCC 22665]|nr:hypothetical protein H9P43_006473 [Blastocladiella emersonii ATCC 22665]
MGLFSWFSGNSSSAADAPAPEVDPTHSSTFSGDLETVPRNNTVCYHLEGFLSCEYFQSALSLGSRVAATSNSAANPNGGEIHVDTNIFSESEFFGSRLPELKQQLRERVSAKGALARHRTCPIVYEGCDEVNLTYVGGYDDFAKVAAERHGVRPQ